MRIRATVLTPVLAIMTVVALIGTGIALGQSGQGDASAYLIDESQDFASSETTDTTAGLQTTSTDEIVQPEPEVPATQVDSTAGVAAAKPTAKKTASPTPTNPPTTQAPAPASVSYDTDDEHEYDDDEYEADEYEADEYESDEYDD